MEVLDETGTSVYSVEDTALSSYDETVREFTVNGTNISMTMYEFFDSYNGYKVFPEVYDNGVSTGVIIANGAEVSIERDATLDYGISKITGVWYYGSIYDMYDDINGKADAWQVTYANEEPGSVPEPSVLMGSLLAAGVGFKALKRGKKQ